jgi:hypothetical protein
MNGDTGYELIKRITAISDRIRALKSLQSQSAKVASILEELKVVSEALPDPTWRSLRESIPDFQKLLTSKAPDEKFIKTRDDIADALDSMVGAGLLNEEVNLFNASVEDLQNLNWEHLQTYYVPQVKVISDLFPASVAKHQPQEYEMSQLMPLVMERVAAALPILAQQQTKPDKVAKAQESLEDVLRSARNNPTAMKLFKPLEAMVLQLRLKTETDEATRAKLEARLGQFISSLKDAPLSNVSQAQSLVKQASTHIADGIKSQTNMNLEEATRSLNQAQDLLDAAGTQLDSGDTDNVASRSTRDLIKGYRAVASSLRAYTAALRAGIMGELQKKHIDALKESDKAWFDNRESLKKAGLILGSSPEQMNVLADAMDKQRVVNRNLLRLGKLSLSPGHTSRVAVPMFLLFFIASFIVITITLRLSGTIDTLGGTTIVFLVVASFAASLIATFGYQAPKFLPFLNALTGFWRKG